MKKFTLLFSTALLAISLAGCANSTPPLPPESTPAAETPRPTPVPTTVPTPVPTPQPVIPEDYPAIDIMTDGNAVLSADILTKRLVPCIKLSSTPEQPVFNNKMFLCQLSGMEDERFCYYNIFPLIGYNKQFKITNAEKVIHQVFGDYSWSAKEDFGTPPNGGFNEATQSYEFSTDFGWGVQFYHARDGVVNSEFNNDRSQVVSRFEMMAPDSSTGDPDHKSIGDYQCVYDIITENGETFLRFNRFEKI